MKKKNNAKGLPQWKWAKAPMVKKKQRPKEN